jgi:hypothetical protein
LCEKLIAPNSGFFIYGDGYISILVGCGLRFGLGAISTSVRKNPPPLCTYGVSEIPGKLKPILRPGVLN